MSFSSFNCSSSCFLHNYNVYDLNIIYHILFVQYIQYTYILLCCSTQIANVPNIICYVLNTYVRFMFYVCHLIMRPKLSRLVSMASILRLRVFELTTCESSFSTIVSLRIKCITQGRSPVRFDEPFLTPVRSRNSMCSDRVGLEKHISGLTCVRPYILS